MMIIDSIMTEEWLNKNANSNQIDDKNNELCKGMVIEVDDNVDNCRHISRDLCNGIVTMKKITIPSNSKIDFYSESGVKLVGGKSYCVYKPPPPFFNNNNCNESWGFWQYSLKNEQWQCKSKVPGIYNSNTNRFNPCSKGELLFNNKLLPNDKIPRLASPEYFFDPKYQKKFTCKCPPGYVFRKDLSRTSCFKDPCLANLPPHAKAPGYDVKTGNCLCGTFFTNLRPDNLKSPCTACPEAPSWNPDSNLLSIYVKCNSHFPCITIEDKMRGCVKATVKVKPITVTDETTFEDLIFI